MLMEIMVPKLQPNWRVPHLLLSANYLNAIVVGVKEQLEVVNVISVVFLLAKHSLEQPPPLPLSPIPPPPLLLPLLPPSLTQPPLFVDVVGLLLREARSVVSVVNPFNCNTSLGGL